MSVGDKGEAAAAGVVVSAAVAGVSVVVAVVSAVGEVTGVSSCGAVEDKVDCSSFTGTAVVASVEVGVTASFLPKILPKIEFLLFGFGAASLVVSATVGSALVAGATPEAPTPVIDSPAGMTGSPITRDAVRS